MKKKVLSVVLSVAMVATLLAGCGAAAEAPAADTAAVEEPSSSPSQNITTTGVLRCMGFAPKTPRMRPSSLSCGKRWKPCSSSTASKASAALMASAACL